uniref:Uncharacterized protein n=1 Tax=Grammatophora oceanica TaxID=210454 RepID=A0A7S1Y2R4_9STRA|mmetsp:Transcript_14758/g.21697  ORF Transcript_14758/g.21697 Transcript_14758/m.21697 type:complete len:139 (+) Transcript_14758:129-545(+)
MKSSMFVHVVPFGHSDRGQGVGDSLFQIVGNLFPQIFEAFSHDLLHFLKFFSRSELTSTCHNMALRIHDAEVSPSRLRQPGSPHLHRFVHGRVRSVPRIEGAGGEAFFRSTLDVGISKDSLSSVLTSGSSAPFDEVAK